MRRGAAPAALSLAVLLAAAPSCAPRRAPPAPEEVVFWQSRPAALVAPLVAEFEREHPGLRVRLGRPPAGRDALLAAAEADSAPDLCEVPSEWMPTLLARGALSDWSAGVADLRPGLLGWDLCMVGDALYGLPWLLGTRALFYDRALLERARLDPDRPPETWDELVRAAAAVQRLGHGVHGFGQQGVERHVLSEAVLPFMWGNGGRILTDDLRRAVLDSVQNADALQFYLGLRRVGLQGSREALEREFLAGRLGLLVSGPRLCARIAREAPGLRYGVALVPRPGRERGTHASWARGEVLVSLVASRRKQHALELARFLAAPERVAAVARAADGLLPSTVGADTSAWGRARPCEAALARQLQTTRFTPNHPAWNDMEAALEDELAQALEGGKTADEAVRDAQARLAALAAGRRRALPGPATPQE